MVSAKKAALVALVSGIGFIGYNSIDGLAENMPIQKSIAMPSSQDDIKKSVELSNKIRQQREKIKTLIGTAHYIQEAFGRQLVKIDKEGILDDMIHKRTGYVEFFYSNNGNIKFRYDLNMGIAKFYDLHFDNEKGLFTGIKLESPMVQFKNERNIIRENKHFYIDSQQDKEVRSEDATNLRSITEFDPISLGYNTGYFSSWPLEVILNQNRPLYGNRNLRFVVEGIDKEGLQPIIIMLDEGEEFKIRLNPEHGYLLQDEERLFKGNVTSRVKVTHGREMSYDGQEYWFPLFFHRDGFRDGAIAERLDISFFPLYVNPTDPTVFDKLGVFEPENLKAKRGLETFVENLPIKVRPFEVGLRELNYSEKK